MAVRIGSTGLLATLLSCAELASIIVIVGCAGPRLRLDAPAEPDGTSFQSAYTRWTRDGSVVSKHEFDTTLLVSATLRSRAFQRAYTERYLKVYQVTDPAERARIEQAELALPDTGLHFWVRTASHQDRANDLTPAKGRWRVALVVPGDQAGMPDSEVLPDEVTAVVRGEAVETALFDLQPDVYRRVWHVRFPPLKPGPAPGTGTPGVGVPTGPRKLTLRFAGPDGKTDLVWLVE